MKRGLLTAMTLLLFGCTTVPISTQKKLASYDGSDYLGLDFAGIRVRVTSDTDDSSLLDHAILSIEAKKKDGTEIKFPGALVLESEQDLTPQGFALPFTYRPEHRYVFKLDEDGVVSFRRLRALMQESEQEARRLEASGETDDRKGSLTITLGWDGVDMTQAEKSRLTVELILDEREGYFTMLNKFTVDPARYAR